MTLTIERTGAEKYPEELIQRVCGWRGSPGLPVVHVAADLGMHPETLRKRVRHDQTGRGAG